MNRTDVPDFLVVGGAQRKVDPETREWSYFEKGLIFRVSGRGEVQRCVEYESPPEVCADGTPSIIFKSGTLVGDRLWVCTQTEVLTYSVPDFRRVRYVSHPCFNDLHHVHATREGKCVAVVTGLDMVVELSPDGSVSREWCVLGGDPWERFSRETDYRKVLTTKPHRSHPNCAFVLGDEIWVTRFEQRDAVCLNDGLRRMPIDVERPHDGRSKAGKVYFTTIDGNVVACDPEKLVRTEVYNLNEMVKGVKTLGWCRGLALLGESLALVGFSRLRPTRFKANLAWLKKGVRNLKRLANLPTRVVLFDLARGRAIAEWNVEKWGMNAIFSIHPLDPTAGPD